MGLLGYGTFVRKRSFFRKRRGSTKELLYVNSTNGNLILVSKTKNDIAIKWGKVVAAEEVHQEDNDTVVFDHVFKGPWDKDIPSADDICDPTTVSGAKKLESNEDLFQVTNKAIRLGEKQKFVPAADGEKEWCKGFLGFEQDALY